MAIKYIADMHLGHENAIRFDGRPFDSVQEMNAKLIENWNKAVGTSDTVYILGDFCWESSSEWDKYLRILNGRKILIIGNHDMKRMPESAKRYFDEIADYKEIRDGEKGVIMSHYAMPFHKRAYDPNVWMLYGHVHTTREEAMLHEFRLRIRSSRSEEKDACGNFVNVGCMLPWMNYEPKSLDEIIDGVLKYIDKPVRTINERPVYGIE